VFFSTCIQRQNADSICFTTVPTGYEEKSPTMKLHNTVSPLFEDMHTPSCLWDSYEISAVAPSLYYGWERTRRTMKWNKLFKTAQSLYKGARIWILALEHTIISVEHKYRVFWEFQKLYIKCLEHNTLTLLGFCLYGMYAECNKCTAYITQHILNTIS